jgi:hypothetical protein
MFVIALETMSFDWYVCIVKASEEALYKVADKLEKVKTAVDTVI